MKRPTVRLKICNPKPAYSIGDVLECECSVGADPELQLQAVETSVVWLTEGKGEEDLGVHFFDRRNKNEVRDGDLGTIYRFKTRLPNSPLSYDGRLVKIHWMVRVCVFYDRGKELRHDLPICLGPAKLLEASTATLSDSSDTLASEQRVGA